MNNLIMVYASYIACPEESVPLWIIAPIVSGVIIIAVIIIALIKICLVIQVCQDICVYIQLN